MRFVKLHIQADSYSIECRSWLVRISLKDSNGYDVLYSKYVIGGRGDAFKIAKNKLVYLGFDVDLEVLVEGEFLRVYVERETHSLTLPSARLNPK